MNTGQGADRPELIRVIIIDDHQMFVEAITHVLERRDDIEVVGTATTGTEGLALAARVLPSVAIVDYQLPDSDGAALTLAMRSASADTKVLILSGSSVAQNVVAAIEAGCAGFVTKDKAADELAAAIRVVHGGEPYIDPGLLAQLLPRVKRSYRRVGDDLTRREREVLALLAEGLSNQAIADQLVVSVHTVRNHVQNVLEKLHAHSKLEAVAIANREGVLDP